MSQRLPAKCVIQLAIVNDRRRYSLLPNQWKREYDESQGKSAIRIKQISFRYGGSSQYFLSGQQVLQAALSMAADGSSRDAILSLGGDALTGAQLEGTPGADGAQGFAWLPLPHCVPTAEGKLPPIPSDLNIPMVACC